MSSPLRPFHPGLAMLVLAAALNAQQSPDATSTAPAPAAPPQTAPTPAAPAPESDTAPTYDVLQFTPDEAFIDLHASLADAWSATLAELAELKYPVNTGLAYVDVGGQIALGDLWVVVEPHASRSESFTRVRVALNSSTDKAYLQARAEVLLDAVANRLAPPAPQFNYPSTQEEPAEPAATAATATPTTVYETTYVPYYVPTPIALPYYTPYFSSWACWHHTSCWWNNCWLGGGWGCNNWCNNGFSFGWGNCGWHWGFSGCWNNFCASFWSPWWFHSGCGWWNGSACTTGFWPCGWNGWGFSGSFVVGDHIAVVPQHNFQFHPINLDGGVIHKTHPTDFVTAPVGTTPTLRTTPRERRDVPAADLHRRIVVVRSEPRHSRPAEGTPTTIRTPGVSGPVVSVHTGTTTPRAGTVVRLPSANYDSRSSHLPTGHVGTLTPPSSNSGPVSSSPLAYGGHSSSVSHSTAPATGSSSVSVAVAPSAPVFYGGSPTAAPAHGSPPAVSAPPRSAPSVVNVPRTWSAPVSSGHQGGGWSAPHSSGSPAPSMPSGPGPSMHSSGSAGSVGSAGGRGFGRGR